MKVFKEEQKFTQWWLHVIMIITAITPTVIIIKDWIGSVDKSFQSNKSSLFSIIMIVLIHLLIYSAKLKTKIDEYGIHYQFFPFHFSIKEILWEDVKKVYVRNYNPILEYGGWGLRYTFNKRKGTAINVSSNIGIQLELENGKKVLIGTQQKEDVKRVLETYKNKI